MVVYCIIVSDLLQSLPQFFAEIGCWYRLCQVVLDESYDFGRGHFDGSVVIKESDHCKVIMYPHPYPDLMTHNCCPESAVLMNLGNLVGNESQAIMFILQPICVADWFLALPFACPKLGMYPSTR